MHELKTITYKRITIPIILIGLVAFSSFLIYSFFIADAIANVVMIFTIFSFYGSSALFLYSVIRLNDVYLTQSASKARIVKVIFIFSMVCYILSFFSLFAGAVEELDVDTTSSIPIIGSYILFYTMCLIIKNETITTDQNI